MDVRTEKGLMKELALLFSIVSIGLWVAQDGTEVSTDKRLASFSPDQPVSQSDLQRYQRLFHISMVRHPQLVD